MEVVSSWETRSPSWPVVLVFICFVNRKMKVDLKDHMTLSNLKKPTQTYLYFFPYFYGRLCLKMVEKQLKKDT